MPATSQKQLQIADAMSDAAMSWLKNRICVVSIIKNGKIIDHASGTRIEWGGNSYVLTAGHFTSDRSENDITIFAPDQPFCKNLEVTRIHQVNSGVKDAALLEINQKDAW